MINRYKFFKANNRVILHKIKKHWVAISVVTLMFLGGGVITASANSITTSTNGINANTVKVTNPKERSQTITQRASNLHQHILLNNQANRANSNNNAMNKQVIKSPQAPTHQLVNNLHGNNVSKTRKSSKIGNEVQAPHKLLKQSDSDGNSDSDNSDSPIQTGMYLGLNYKYDRSTKDLEFMSGQLQNPTSDSDGSNLATFGFSDGIYPTSIKFDQGVDTSQITSAHGMFNDDPYVQSIDLNNFNSSNITDMSNMFNDDRHLQHITLGNNFDTSKVTNMYAMFANDNLQSLNLPQGFNTKGVVNMKNMFANNNDLQEINIASPNTIFNDSAFMNSVSDSDINSDTWKSTLAHMYLNNSEYSDANLGDGQSHEGQWSLTPNPLNTVSDAKAKLDAQIQLGKHKASDVRQLSDTDQQLGSEITSSLSNLKNGLVINNISDLSDSDQVAKYPVSIKKIKNSIQHESDYLKNVVNHYKNQLSDAYPLQYQISSSDGDSDVVNHIYANAKEYRWNYWRMMNQTSDNFLSVDNQINTASKSINKINIYFAMLKAENQYLTSMNSLILSRKNILNRYVNRIEYDIDHLSHFTPMPSDHPESDNPTTSKAKKFKITNANKAIDQLSESDDNPFSNFALTFVAQLIFRTLGLYGFNSNYTAHVNLGGSVDYKVLRTHKGSILNKNHLPSTFSEAQLITSAGGNSLGFYENHIIDDLTGIGGINIIKLPYNKKFSYAVSQSTVQTIFTATTLILSYTKDLLQHGLLKVGGDFLKASAINFTATKIAKFVSLFIENIPEDALANALNHSINLDVDLFGDIHKLYSDDHDIKHINDANLLDLEIESGERKLTSGTTVDKALGDISNLFSDLCSLGTSFLQHPYYYFDKSLLDKR